jgi:hypothetical protein
VTSAEAAVAAPMSGTRPDVLIITGMSGAGRTEVSKVLEDHDWFVIDNLPPSLLGKVVELAFAPGSSVTRVAGGGRRGGGAGGGGAAGPARPRAGRVPRATCGPGSSWHHS